MTAEAMATECVCELEVSAASGLVKRDGLLYVVADDEHFLEVLTVETGRRAHRLALFDTPEAHAVGSTGYAKAHKPDFESLVALPGERLLALGSGSTPARERGVLVGCDGAGVPAVVATVDLRPLYTRLRAMGGELNLEGAALVGEALCLLQRGAGVRPSRLVVLDARRALEDLGRGVLGAEALVATHPVVLGMLDGVALALTDASPLGAERTRIAFAAAAEDTANAYDDGACVGSVVGEMDLAGRVLRTARVHGTHKVEGLAVDGARAWLVADPDDRSVRAPLLRAAWPWV